MMREINDGCTCSYKTRMYGFAGCFIVGIIIAGVSCIFVPKMAQDPAPFAILYTIGNIICLLSSAFIVGPCKQLSMMFDSKRWIATVVYIVSMALTLYFAIGLEQAILVLIALVIQLLALIWYCLSYIPYARQMFTKCAENMCGSC